jgi:hypothetical protein
VFYVRRSLNRSAVLMPEHTYFKALPPSIFQVSMHKWQIVVQIKAAVFPQPQA